MSEIIQEPQTIPLKPDLIVVQSQGMRRWLSLELAERLGVFANTRFQFPNQLIWDLLGRVIPEIDARPRFDREEMVWLILKALPKLLESPPFNVVRNYLLDEQGQDAIRAYQLATRVAYVFDQYCMYRPDLVNKWETGKEDHWQASLWRSIEEDNQLIHLPGLRSHFFEIINSQAGKVGELPERLFVFGITSLPVLHIELLKAFSEFRDVHLFFLNPSKEFWADISSEKDTARRLNRMVTSHADPEDFYFEVGNNLLASFGKTGQSFFQTMVALDAIDTTDDRSFVSPGRSSLLTSAQTDIFELTEPSRESGTKNTIANKDTSIQIHSCHSRTREVEVLWDRLLHMFDTDRSLTPSDILVMAPDIDPYVPIVESVFSSNPKDAFSFPYSIADRRFWRESRILTGFLQLLDIPDSRFELSTVFELLDLEPIASRFDLTDGMIETIRSWIEAANVRWGIDAQHRSSFDIPGNEENTWKFGIERLLLGIAMPDDEISPFQGILPKDLIEGSNSAIFGQFLDFFALLTDLAYSRGFVHQRQSGQAFLDLMNKQRTLKEWSSYMNQVMESFFAVDDRWESDLQSLRDILHQLEDEGDNTRYDIPVSFDVIKLRLKEEIEKLSIGPGFLGSGITFCSMLPMRSIPVKVIALLGINERDFPRSSSPVSFNLIASQPRIGDRSQQEDDRYLFLEAFISATETLYISFVGQRITDNTAIPPSPLISELLYYLDKNYILDSGKTVSDHIVRRHHLQAFNSKYFSASDETGSYSIENFEAAKTHLNASGGIRIPFIDSLGEPGPEWRTIDLDHLINFFSHPAKFLLRNRLGLYMEGLPELPEETEPLTISHLERYLTSQSYLDEILSDGSTEALDTRYLAEGILPPGPLGADRLREVHDSAVAFSNTIRPFLEGGKKDPTTVDLSIDDFRLTGELSDIWSKGLIFYRPATIKLKDLTRHWIEHLCLQAVQKDIEANESVMIGLKKSSEKPDIIHLGPVADPLTLTRELLEIYWQGLSKPLALFPKTSLKYMETLRGNKPENALKSARDCWASSFGSSESDDPYLARCFGNKQNPLDDEFQETAKKILNPLFDHLKTE